MGRAPPCRFRGRGRGGAPLVDIPEDHRSTRVTRAFNNSLAAAISQSAPLGGPARTAVLFSDSEESDMDKMGEGNMNMDVDNSPDTPVNNVS